MPCWKDLIRVSGEIDCINPIIIISTIFYFPPRYQSDTEPWWSIQHRNQVSSLVEKVQVQLRDKISSLQKIEQMTLFQLTRLPPNVAGRQHIVEGDICWIFGVFCAIKTKSTDRSRNLYGRPLWGMVCAGHKTRCLRIGVQTRNMCVLDRARQISQHEKNDLPWSKRHIPSAGGESSYEVGGLLFWKKK